MLRGRFAKRFRRTVYFYISQDTHFERLEDIYRWFADRVRVSSSMSLRISEIWASRSSILRVVAVMLRDCSSMLSGTRASCCFAMSAAASLIQR
jgi:hypothetical protein